MAIDALRLMFSKMSEQLMPICITRELGKAYAGFKGPFGHLKSDKDMRIVTGNWGCGAFGGNP